MNPIFCLFFLLAAMFLPQAALAFDDEMSDSFANDSAVPVEELDTMRGGAFTFGGITYDFAYLQEIHKVYMDTGLTEITSARVTADDIQLVNSIARGEVPDPSSATSSGNADSGATGSVGDAAANAVTNATGAAAGSAAAAALQAVQALQSMQVVQNDQNNMQIQINHRLDVVAIGLEDRFRDLAIHARAERARLRF